jgi:glycosyltransferase involved in cell wall biosynthesis
MIKVLGLALYGPLAASTRYRLTQYVPGLARRGIDLQICHLLGDEYLRRRFSGSALPVAAMLRAGLARLSDLQRQTSFDAAMLYCELFPMIPGRLERALIRLPYIYDFDDAFFLKYRSGRLAFAKPLLGNKFATLISGARAVTAGNHLLARYAHQFNPVAEYLPTVVDTRRYVPVREGPSNIFTVGWIGSPSTAHYLDELIEPLSILGSEGPVRLVVVGGKAPVVPGLSVIEMAWQEETEVALINSFDVGVMPLRDDEWARGKCAFKLIQYLACAVPVVASRVGANIDVVNDECGFLATTADEWVEAFRALRDQPKQRAEMGQAGRERVMKHYSLHRNLPVLESTIRQLTMAGGG